MLAEAPRQVRGQQFSHRLSGDLVLRSALRALRARLALCNGWLTPTRSGKRLLQASHGVRGLLPTQLAELLLLRCDGLKAICN